MHHTESLQCCVMHRVGRGSWTTAGITTDDVMAQNGNLTTVRCNSIHLTSFAVLVDVVGKLEVIQWTENAT